MAGKDVPIKYPGGIRGIAKTTTREDQQEEIFLPTDNILIAVNVGKDTDFGTIVIDTNDDNEIDPDRAARLQSAFRVIKYPEGMETCAIAFQLGPSGKKDTKGYFVDRLAGGEVEGQTVVLDGKIAVAKGSYFDGGPFDCGTGKCAHKVGDDDEGNPISMLHISTKALFRKNDDEDGPLKFEGPLPPPNQDLAQRIDCHLSWDAASKRWYWWTTSVLSPPWMPHPVMPHIPNPPPPPDPTRYPVVPWPPPPSTPTGTPTPGTPRNPPLPPPPPGGNESVPTYDRAFRRIGPDGKLYDPFETVSKIDSSPTNGMFLQASLSPLAAPAMAFRPQNYTPGSIETGVFNVPNSESKSKANNAPITAIMSAFGAQGGTMAQSGYPAAAFGAQGDPWRYTQQPANSKVRNSRNAKYLGGTSSGGVTFHPPEVDLRDVAENGMAPSGVTRSTCYVLVAPNAWFGAGVPQLVNGSIQDGYSWGMDESTGDLIFRAHSQSAAPEEAIRFTKTSRNILWFSGASFYGEIDHTNTGNRTYTFPDRTGPVGMMLTGSGSPAGSVTAPESTMYWDTSGDALYVNNDSATAWTHIAGGGGGTVTGSGTANQVAYWTSASNISGEANFTWTAASDLLSVTGGTILTGGGLFTGAPLSVIGSATTIVVGYSSATAAHVNNTLEFNTDFKSSLGGSTTTGSLQWRITDDTAQNGIFNVWNIAGGTLGIKLKIQGSQVMTHSGTVTAPGLSWISDTESGWYLIGTDNIGASINQTLVYDWNATRLKLVTDYKLHLGATGNVYGSAVTSDELITGLRSLNGILRWALKNSNTGATAQATIGCVNDESTDVALFMNGSGAGTVEGGVSMFRANGAGAANRPFHLHNGMNSYMRFSTNDTERMRLLAGGQLCIGATAVVGSEILNVNGAFRAAGNAVLGANCDITSDLTALGNATVGAKLVVGSTTRTISGGAAQAYIAAAGQVQLYFDVNNGGSNEKLWDINPVLKVMQFRVINDANSAATNYMEAERSGTTIVRVNFPSSPVGIGHSSTPSAQLHVTQGTVGNEVFRIESTATNDDPADRWSHGRVATTDATVTTIQTVTIPASTTVALEVVVRARRTGGAAGSAEDGAHYVRYVTYKNVGGTATIIGAVSPTHTAESQAGWDVTFNVSGGDVQIQVTGAADNNVTWHSTVRMSPVGS